MPVTITCASVEPAVFDFDANQPPKSHSELFTTSASRKAADEARKAQYSDPPSEIEPFVERVLQVELTKGPDANAQVVRCENGLVNTITSAYNRHYHLVLRYDGIRCPFVLCKAITCLFDTFRPDDIWIAILAQFSLYVNGNDEKLRSKFVAHEGKKEYASYSSSGCSRRV